MARRALAPLDCPVLLLKGTAYAIPGLAAGRGRAIGDLDILVPRDRLGDVHHTCCHSPPGRSPTQVR